MPSWQSYFIQPILWFRVKLRLILSNSAHDAREAFNHHPPVPHGAHFRADTVGGVHGEWAKSKHEPVGTLLYLHGGGYFACSPKTHRSITGAFAVRGFKVFAPDYRLAPEHLFPAAVDDALATYKGLLETTPPGQLLIGGDSAGGGLALSTLLAAKAEGLPMPPAPSPSRPGPTSPSPATPSRKTPTTTTCCTAPKSPRAPPSTCTRQTRKIRLPRRCMVTSPACRLCCSRPPPTKSCSTIPPAWPNAPAPPGWKWRSPSGQICPTSGKPSNSSCPKHARHSTRQRLSARPPLHPRPTARKGGAVRAKTHIPSIAILRSFFMFGL